MRTEVSLTLKTTNISLGISPTGQNFRQDIKQVILRTNIGAREIILPKEKVQHINNTTLKLSFSLR